MPALHQTTANNIIDATVGTAAFVANTGSARVALVGASGATTYNGTATAAGTEVVPGANAYARQVVTFNAASAGSATSSNTLTYSNMPATTVTGVEIFDSAATPLRRWYGPLQANKTTNAGDTFTINSGSLTLTLG